MGEAHALVLLLHVVHVPAAVGVRVGAPVVDGEEVETVAEGKGVPLNCLVELFAGAFVLSVGEPEPSSILFDVEDENKVKQMKPTH